MTPRESAAGVFYYARDPATAADIAHRGFEHSGIWGAASTVVLLDRLPTVIDKGILRISLTPERPAEVLRRGVPLYGGEGDRRFVVPMEVLRNAFVVLLAMHASVDRPPGLSREQ